MHARGVGPEPIPVEEFSLDKLVAAINFMLDPKVSFFPDDEFRSLSRRVELKISHLSGERARCGASKGDGK